MISFYCLKGKQGGRAQFFFNLMLTHSVNRPLSMLRPGNEIFMRKKVLSLLD